MNSDEKRNIRRKYNSHTECTNKNVVLTSVKIKPLFSFDVPFYCL